jgi:hypothetical protein
MKITEDDDLLVLANKEIERENPQQAIAIALLDIAESQRQLIQLEVQRQQNDRAGNMVMMDMMKRQVDAIAPDAPDSSITRLADDSVMTAEEIDQLSKEPGNE